MPYLLIPGLLVAFVCTFFLLQRIVPKGNLLQELLTLPTYLYRVWQTPTNRMTVKKHPFGKQAQQYLLCCEPKAGALNNQKVFLYYHGGGWIFGRPEQFITNAQFFVDRGYTVFIPSYRRPPFYAYREIDQDLSAALVLTKSLMAEKGLADSRILLGGMSAGGNLVALLLYDRQRLKKLGWSHSLFSGILLFGAPLDLNQMPFSLPLYLYAGSRKGSAFQQANPSFHLSDSENTPVCWIHGDRDGMVPLRASQGFIEKLEKIQKRDISKYLLKGGSHLDAGSWIFGDNETWEALKDWLEKAN